MNGGPRYVSFRDYLRVARERRLLIAIVTLLCLAAGLAYTLTAKPVYEASASLEFQSPNEQSSLFGVFQDVGGETPEQRAAANAETIKRVSVLQRVQKIMHTNRSTAALSDKIDAQPEPQTQLVIVTAQAGSAAGAADLANAVARAAVDVTRDETRARFQRAAKAQQRVLHSLNGPGAIFQRAQMQQDIARLKELANVAQPASIQRGATSPTAATGPRRAVILVLALLAGLILGLVAAFGRDSLDRRFKSVREISEDLHLPMLGFVPEDTLGRSVVNGKGRRRFSHAAFEGFRILRANIEFLDVDTPPKMLVVTSALPEEGKSTVSTGLAAAYAAAGKRTLLVECDLRRPTLAGRLGIKSSPGLTDYLVGNATPVQVTQTVVLPASSLDGDQAATYGGDATVPLVAIVAGSPAPQPAELLRSKRCRAFFEQVKQVYDVVVVDSSPLLSVADTLEILPVSDAVVVCMRASKTTREQAGAAKAALSHLPERPTGVVVTGFRAREEGPYYGYYSYGEVYGAPRQRTGTR